MGVEVAAEVAEAFPDKKVGGHARSGRPVLAACACAAAAFLPSNQIGALALSPLRCHCSAIVSTPHSVLPAAACR